MPRGGEVTQQALELTLSVDSNGEESGEEGDLGEHCSAN